MITLRKILPYLLQHKGSFAIVILFGILMSACDSAMVYLVKTLFEEVFQNKNISYALIIPAAIPIVYFFHGIGRFGHLYFMKFTGEKIATRIQSELQDKYMHLSLSYYGGTNSGGMISKVINDVAVFQWGINIFSDIVREPITILILLGWVFYLDWKLTLLLLTVGPLIVFIINRLSRSVRKYSHKQQETMEQFTSTLKETVDGVRIIQSFNLMEEMRRRMRVVIDYYLSVRKKIISRQEVASPISEFLAAVLIGAIFYYKGQDIIAGRSTIGDFMGYITALGFIQQPIKKLQDGVMRLQPTLAAAERIFNVIEAKEIVPEVPQAKPFPKNWKEIEFRDVSFAYHNDLVLKNISLKIKRGELIALVGESGSGKSTFVNLLERFYDPSQGEILIDGLSTKDMNLFDLRQNIALVTQDVFLFNDTIARNIQSGNFNRETHTVEECARMANAHDFIARMPEGYNTMAGDRGSRLSGGEKQRISIARAIYKDAPILILDEATSALDSASEVEVQKGLDKLMEGRTAFVVAHRLSTIVKADRILVFKNGEIIEQGTHADLMSKQGVYFDFHALQRI